MLANRFPVVRDQRARHLSQPVQRINRYLLRAAARDSRENGAECDPPGFGGWCNDEVDNRAVIGKVRVFADALSLRREGYLA
jgi:hypothetical protein